jgi:dolichyl-phosphate beta-glucosyltransferase
LLESFSRSKAGTYVINNEVNFGKGFSVQQGMLTARGRFRLFSDADLSTPIEEVNNLLPLVDSASGSAQTDIVIGSRRVKGSKIEVRQPIHREAAGRFFSLLVRMMVVRGYLDTQCGFKLFSAEAASDIFRRITIPGFGFDVELLYIAKKRGFRVEEAPVSWQDSPDSTVRLHRDAARMFMDLLRVRWRGLWGAYA